jgi:hypothetical protein
MILELAKAGEYGDTVLTEADLDQLELTFSGNIPVTVGHEISGEMPAFGWVKNIWSQEGVLMGEVELGHELSEAYENGAYRNWSIGAKRDAEGRFYLHHLAFLGALPPKIRGLEVIEMGDGAGVTSIYRFDASFVTGELNVLRKERRSARLSGLREAAAGKIPAAKLGALLELADNLEGTVNFSDGTAADVLGILTDTFASLAAPVKEGCLDLPEAKSGKAANIFGKI